MIAGQGRDAGSFFNGALYCKQGTLSPWFFDKSHQRFVLNKTLRFPRGASCTKQARATHRNKGFPERRE